MTPLEVCAFRARCGETDMPVFSAVDFTRPFLPEPLTQLYHTSYYERFSPTQRLRYNQLFGMRTNEQFMMFEQDLANPVAAGLLGHEAVTGVPGLVECVTGMIREEERHQAMFLDLNRLCLPEVYARQSRYFTRLTWIEGKIFGLATTLMRTPLFLMMVIMVLEEATTVLSRRVMQAASTGGLGPLEPNFVAAHSAHLKDEARHIHIDVSLIETLLAATPAAHRRRSGFLFRRLISEILAPKRSGVRVIRRLVEEYPDLGPQSDGMVQAVRGLGMRRGFFTGLFDHETLPHTFGLFERYPEFSIPLDG